MNSPSISTAGFFADGAYDFQIVTYKAAGVVAAPDLTTANVLDGLRRRTQQTTIW